jgi:hypothetical protein
MQQRVPEHVPWQAAFLDFAGQVGVVVDLAGMLPLQCVDGFEAQRQRHDRQDQASRALAPSIPRKTSIKRLPNRGLKELPRS